MLRPFSSSLHITSDNGITISEMSVCIVSENYNAPDADVVFQSCDDVLFKIHRGNLASGTGGFPPSGFGALDEIVPLTESSSTLEVLFQYIYPVPQPDIASLPFETVVDVAEAAEKYKIYPAMYVCKLVMGMILPANAPKIFAYAGRHGYKDLLSRAAPLLIKTPLHEVMSELPRKLIVPWIKYYSAWENLLHKARLYPYKNEYRRRFKLSEGHHVSIITCIAKLEDVKSLANLAAVFGDRDNRDGDEFLMYLREWRAEIESNVKGMKSFDTYLNC